MPDQSIRLPFLSHDVQNKLYEYFTMYQKKYKTNLEQGKVNK